MTAAERKLMAEGYATVQEATKYLRCCKTRTYELIHGGILSHARHGGRFVIPWAAVKSYARQCLVIGKIA
jgi:excisionase family DNA binding protein